MTNTTSQDSSYDNAIALIGMSGRFPGAQDVATFWQNIAGGVKSIRFFSAEELLAAGIKEEIVRDPNFVKAGTVLKDLDLFDASFFGYTPREAEIMDPQHRLFLECAWEAFEEAAYDPETYRGLVGVFAGSGFSTYMRYNIYSHPDLVDLVGIIQIAAGNERDSLASMVSYKLNLRGPGISIQTFCSTSLVAVHLACQSLLSYECDMALAGGVAISVPQENGYSYEEGGILSPDGECRTFDADAQGSVMGNGVGVVALKRLEEALRDGDHIYAIIRGSAVNNDGNVRVGYTAPGLDGQTEVIAEALANAGVDPETVSYIEAHGTATPLGDSIELAAMIKAYRMRTQQKQFCAIGSVKPNIGHLDRASGVTGLIKTAMALKHQQIPPSLNFEHASPDIDLDNSPFYVNTQLSDWLAKGQPRRAGVSSFGLGGTNAHVILEEASELEPASPSRSSQLLLLSAKSEVSLAMATHNLVNHLRTHPQQALADIAYTLQIGRSAFNHRRIMVCHTHEDGAKKLETIETGHVWTSYQTYRDRPVAFLFPGVGEQYPGMARDLYEQEPIFRETVDHCCQILKSQSNLDLQMVLFPDDDSATGLQPGGLDLRALLNRNGQASTSPMHQHLMQTAVAQPAVFVIEYALVQLLKQWGIEPQALIGYSLGEYVAACIAGVFSLEDGLALVAQRAQLIQELTPGAMTAVPLSVEEVSPYLSDRVSLAAVNGPRLCVLAGPIEAIAYVEMQLQQQEIAIRRLETTHAFHSTMLIPIKKHVTALVRTLQLHEPGIPYISNVTGTWITAEQATDPGYWAEHMCQTVRFDKGLEHLLRDGDTERCMLEVGPGQTLSSMLKQHPACKREAHALILPTLSSSYERQLALPALLTAVGRLWLAGVTINWAGFYSNEERRLRMSLPTYPFDRKRHWIDIAGPSLLDGTPSFMAEVSARQPQKKKANLADWFYLPSWEKVPLEPDSAKEPRALRSPALIFLDAFGLAEQVACHLEKDGMQIVRVAVGDAFLNEGDRRFTIRPHEQADYQHVINALSRARRLPKTIVHAWSLSAPTQTSSGPAFFDHVQQYGFYSLLFLVQALGTLAEAEPTQLVILSNNVQAVTAREPIFPENATLLGACKVIPQELLHLACRSIDLAVPASGSWDDPVLSEAVSAEVRAGSRDPVVAYRDDTRWVQTYVPQNFVPTPSTPALRPQGVYLITGGLGGVGLVLAEHLARRVQARLVLLGRSPLPARTQWESWLESHEANDPLSQKIRQLQKIEGLGAELLVLEGDVANQSQMQAVIQQTVERFGVLHGVIHAAGISDGKAFVAAQEIGPSECGWHFQPKVHGLYVLEEVLHGLPLDFCILFSSLSSVLGGLWLFAYAAANRFLDAYAAQHNQQPDAVPWLSVNWDTWDVRENAHGGLGATLAEYTMTPEEGTRAFEYVLNAHGYAHIVESTGDLHTRIRQWVQLESLDGADETTEATTSTSTGAAASLADTYTPASGDYERKIAAIWQRVLGINEVGLHDNFFDLGGNSLSGLQVLAKLRKEFHLQIPVVALFEAPTVSTLARYLLPSPTVALPTQRAQLAQRRQKARHNLDQQAIAIIGMSGRFPGASTPERFWQNQVEGRESVSFFSDDELREAGVDPLALAQANYVKARPILQDVDLFDATFFGYSPREAEITDPQHRLFLECAWEALEQAGYDPQRYDGLIGVFGGTNLSNYLDRLNQDPELIRGINDYQRVIGNDKDSLTTSVSYKMNLTGPSYAVQTFCSTSLVATHLAAQSLRNGECDIALAGGVSIRVPVKAGHLYEEGGMESPDGHCRTFDAQAKGSMFGDGVALVALKRLEDALADGDTISAIIKGSAINNDGSLKVSYTAPSVTGQAAVVQAALANAGVDAESLNYIEAHGTATELGDPIEVASLTRAFRTQTQRVGYCAIGSVKTNVGHLDRAAGVTGLIRVVQALQHEQLPPILHYQAPNPEIDFAQSPFVVNTQLREWKRNGQPRRAGINSLGMGGTNVHVIVEEAPEQEPSGPSRGQQVLLLSARTETALETMTENLLRYLEQYPEQKLEDVAYTLQVGRKGFDHRRALVCQSRGEALSELQARNPHTVWTSYQTYRDRPVAFLYPGVGEQYAGMAQELYEQEEIFRDTVDYCCRVLQNKLGLDLRAALFPKDGPGANGQHQSGLDLRSLIDRDGRASISAAEQPLAHTVLAQPAIFVIEYALTQLLRQWGIEPKALIGYSLGEYVAACVAGVFSLDDALLLVARRAQLIQALPQGAMLAVPLSEQDVQPYLNEQVDLALINGPRLCILAGPVAAMKHLEQILQKDGITFRNLVTTHAFHSKMLAPCQEAVAELVQSITLKEPRIPYISNMTGTWITAEEATRPAYWAEHMCRTVRFADGLEHLLRDGDREQLCLEVGPGQSLSSMVKQHPACDRQRFSQVLPTLPSVYERLSSQAFLLGTLGKLWLAGVTINWTSFSQGERRHHLPLPTYPFERQRYWLEPRKGSALQNVVITGPDGELPRLADIADWFYLPSWKMSFLPHRAEQAFVSKDNWLLFIDECGIGKQLKEQLKQRQQHVTTVTRGNTFARQGEGAYTIRAGHRSDYDLLLKDLRKRSKTPTKVVHLWTVTPETPPAADNAVIEETLDKGFYSLLALVQTIGDMGVEDCEITIVSNEMQDVTGDEAVCPVKATVMGACRVISQEYTNIRARGIDIVLPGREERQAQALLDQLLTELATKATEPIVALRGRQRWIQTFEEARLEAKQDQATVLREGGVYLITGGLGGIALAMAEHLARTARVKLVLTARTSLPPRHEWNNILATRNQDDKTVSRIRKVLALEELGAEVLIAHADVANEAQMREAVQQALARFGTIHGVFHTAGLPGVGLMQLKKPEVAAEVLATKVAGTVVLERILQSIALDFLVLFSSITSTTGGGPGQLDYCAANAFLDAYAHRNATRHGMTIAINWGEWQWNAWEEGLNGFDQETQVRFKEIRKRFGVGFADGAEALMRILAHRVPHVIVTTQNFRIMRELSKTAHNDIDKNRQARQKRPAYPRPLLGVSYTSPRSDLEKHIAAIWEELLGIEQVGSADNFFELGGNSLIGIDLVIRLRKELNIDTIPAYALYEAPTVSAMAQYIEQDKTDDASIEGRLERGEKRRASLKQRMREPGRTR